MVQETEVLPVLKLWIGVALGDAPESILGNGASVVAPGGVTNDLWSGRRTAIIGGPAAEEAMRELVAQAMGRLRQDLLDWEAQLLRWQEQN